MIYPNTRMGYEVETNPLDSPQEYRLFTVDIFKEVGPPHPHTQKILLEWTERARPARKKAFQRAAYSPE